MLKLSFLIVVMLNEFCKGKESFFYSAEQSNDKLNLEKFSTMVFRFYNENNLEPFTSWTNALSYINERQGNKKLVLVIDEFTYLAKKNRALLSELQLHLKTFGYQTSAKFMTGFSDEEKLMLYGAYGGTPLYLQQLKAKI